MIDLVIVSSIRMSLQPRSYDRAVATVVALSTSQGSINRSNFRLGPMAVAPPRVSHFSTTRLILRAIEIGLKTSVSVGSMESRKI